MAKVTPNSTSVDPNQAVSQPNQTESAQPASPGPASSGFSKASTPQAPDKGMQRPLANPLSNPLLGGPNAAESLGIDMNENFDEAQPSAHQQEVFDDPRWDKAVGDLTAQDYQFFKACAEDGELDDFVRQEAKDRLTSQQH